MVNLHWGVWRHTALSVQIDSVSILTAADLVRASGKAEYLSRRWLWWPDIGWWKLAEMVIDRDAFVWKR